MENSSVWQHGAARSSKISLPTKGCPARGCGRRPRPCRSEGRHNQSGPPDTQLHVETTLYLSTARCHMLEHVSMSKHMHTHTHTSRTHTHNYTYVLFLRSHTVNRLYVNHGKSLYIYMLYVIYRYMYRLDGHVQLVLHTCLYVLVLIDLCSVCVCVNPGKCGLLCNNGHRPSGKHLTAFDGRESPHITHPSPEKKI